MKAARRNRLEYVVVMVAPRIGIAVTPVTPDTKAIAEEAEQSFDLVDVVNKLAEIGFRLLEGTVLRTDAGKIDGTFFMWRERPDA